MAENKLNSLADESAQQFNDMVSKASTPKEAKSCIEYYKTMEMDFINFKIRYGFDSPIARFRQKTSLSKSELLSKFNLNPESGTFEKVMKSLEK